MKTSFLPKSVILIAVLTAGLFDWAYYGIVARPSDARDLPSVAIADETTGQDSEEPVEIIPFVEVTSEPTLSATLTAEDIVGRAGHRIPVSIEISPRELARKLTILVRGLPEGVNFSAGRPLDNGQWQLEARSTRGVMLTATEGIAGTFKIQMTLYTASGKIEPEVTQTVDLTLSGPSTGPSDDNVESSVLTAIATPDSDQTETPQETARQDPIPERAPPKDTTPEDSQSSVPKLSTEQLDALIARGQQMMDGGDLSGAKLIFEHVEKHITSYSSDIDISGVALALGKLYDPILAAQRLASIPPNPALARKWYGLAANNGNVEAIERLQILEEQLPSGVNSEASEQRLRKPAKQPVPEENTGLAHSVM